MEGVCERMEDYGEVTDPSTDRKSYVRIKPRSGEPMDLSEATLDSRVTASLKFAVSGHFRQDSRKLSANKHCQLNTVSFPLLQCETIVEHHEDEIIEFFAHETDNVKDKLCSKRTGMVWTQISYLLLLDADVFHCLSCLVWFSVLVFCLFCLQISVTTLWKYPMMNFDEMSNCLPLLSAGVFRDGKYWIRIQV